MSREYIIDDCNKTGIEAQQLKAKIFNFAH